MRGTHTHIVVGYCKSVQPLDYIILFSQEDLSQCHPTSETMINLDNLNFVHWDYPAIYEGIMSPENNFIMIIQNFWMTVTSSIGYIFLIPFFQVI